MRPHVWLMLTGVVVMGMGTVACNADDESPSGAPETPEATEAAEASEAAGESPADCPEAPAEPLTAGPQTLRFGGEERSYLLALPDDGGDASAAARPLIVNLHGWGSSKEEFDGLTEMGERGSARGYVVVTPDALGDPPEWNFLGDQARADDYGFVDALMSELTSRLCIDPERTYVSGFSAGSAFTGLLGCRESQRFAAVAMVAALIGPTCPVERAPSVIAIHGTADPQVPYSGGQVGAGGVGIPPALDTFGQYAQQYGCGEPEVGDGPVPGVERRSLPGCGGDRDVVLYTVEGGTHEWPGGTGDVASENGRRFPATDTILDFFDDHTAT